MVHPNTSLGPSFIKTLNHLSLGDVANQAFTLKIVSGMDLGSGSVLKRSVSKSYSISYKSIAPKRWVW